MLWLIWIVLMLIIPCIAGVKVWLDMRSPVEDVSPAPVMTPESKTVART